MTHTRFLLFSLPRSWWFHNQHNVLVHSTSFIRTYLFNSFSIFQEVQAAVRIIVYFFQIYVPLRKDHPVYRNLWGSVFHDLFWYWLEIHSQRGQIHCSRGVSPIFRSEKQKVVKLTKVRLLKKIEQWMRLKYYERFDLLLFSDR